MMKPAAPSLLGREVTVSTGGGRILDGLVVFEGQPSQRPVFAEVGKKSWAGDHQREDASANRRRVPTPSGGLLVRVYPAPPSTARDRWVDVAPRQIVTVDGRPVQPSDLPGAA